MIVKNFEKKSGNRASETFLLLEKEKFPGGGPGPQNRGKRGLEGGLGEQ